MRWAALVLLALSCFVVKAHSVNHIPGAATCSQFSAAGAAPANGEPHQCALHEGCMSFLCCHAGASGRDARDASVCVCMSVASVPVHANTDPATIGFIVPMNFPGFCLPKHFLS